MDAVELVLVGGGGRADDALLLQLILVALGLCEACDDVPVCLETSHGGVLLDCAEGQQRVRTSVRRGRTSLEHEGNSGKESVGAG